MYEVSQPLLFLLAATALAVYINPTSAAYLIRLVYDSGHTNHAVSLGAIGRLNVRSLFDINFARHYGASMRVLEYCKSVVGREELHL